MFEKGTKHRKRKQIKLQKERKNKKNKGVYLKKKVKLRNRGDEHKNHSCKSTEEAKDSEQ